MNNLTKNTLNILKNYLNKGNSFSETDINYDDLTKYAVSLGIGPVVAYTISKNKLTKDTSYLMSILYASSIKTETQKNNRNEIKDLLEKENIDFLFLKGKTIAKYYDEEYLRQSADIDIYVNKDNFEKVKDLLISKLNYKLLNKSSNELSLIKDKQIVDIHNLFSNFNDKYEEMFKDADIKNKEHELDNLHKYLFSIYHTSKHFLENYISLKFLIDIYYLRQLEFDHNLLNEKLDKAGLLKFNQQVNKIINSIINDEKLVSDLVIDFIFNTGHKKGYENKVLVSSVINGDGSKTLINRAFPSTKEMIRLYPNLENKKYLLGIYYLKRFIDRLKEGNINKAFKEIDANVNINKEKIKDTESVLKELGLYEKQN